MLKYHWLRHQEGQSWDRDTLRLAAGAEFTSALEPLLPRQQGQYVHAYLVHVVRPPWFDDYSADLRAILPGHGGTTDLAAIANRSRHRLEPFRLRAPRRKLIGLSLLCHYAKLAGADVPALFREVGGLAGPAMRPLYDEWADRYPGVQQIGAIGWKTVETEEGIGFRPQA